MCLTRYALRGDRNWPILAVLECRDRGCHCPHPGTVLTCCASTDEIDRPKGMLARSVCLVTLAEVWYSLRSEVR